MAREQNKKREKERSKPSPKKIYKEHQRAKYGKTAEEAEKAVKEGMKEERRNEFRNRMNTFEKKGNYLGAIGQAKRLKEIYDEEEKKGKVKEMERKINKYKEKFKEGTEEKKYERARKKAESEVEALQKMLEMEIRDIQGAVDFAKKKDVDLLIAPEAGGRKEAFMFRKVYRKRYPNRKSPKVVYVNFKNIEGGKDFNKKFEKISKELEKGEELNTFVLDECAHSGESIKKAKKTLEEAYEEKGNQKGKVLAGVVSFQPSNFGDKVDTGRELDFFRHSNSTCPGKLFSEGKNIFGTVKSQESDSHVGKKVEDKQKLYRSRVAREEISDIIDEQVKPKKMSEKKEKDEEKESFLDSLTSIFTG